MKPLTQTGNVLFRLPFNGFSCTLTKPLQVAKSRY